MVGLGGLEPPASPLSGVRSNQLSYRPGGEPLKRFVRVCSANARSWRERQTIRVSARLGHRAGSGHPARSTFPLRLAARIPLRLAARIPLRLAARR